MHFYPPPPPLPPPFTIEQLPPCVGPNPGVQLPPPPPLPIPAAAPVDIPGKRINVRNKGQRGEREVVKLLQAVVDVVRTRKGIPPLVIQRNQMQSHLGGEDLTGLDGFAVEVKFQENENVPAWWRQTVEQSQRRGGVVPVLFYRCSRAKWTVKLRAFVNTPGDRDQVEMDIETTVDDFIEWFGNAYDESISGGLPL